MRYNVNPSLNMLTNQQLETVKNMLESVATSPDLYEQAKARVEQVIVEDLDSEQNLLAASQMLDQQGIVIIPGYMEKKLAKSLNAQVDQIIEDHRTHLHAEKDYEDDQLYIDCTNDKFNSYSSLANYKKTVIRRRGAKSGDEDQGMLDVFNIAKGYPDIGGPLEEALGAEEIHRVIRMSTQTEWEARNLNIYIHHGIEKTRGFHVDSYNNFQIKAFLYLTDVVDLQSGPYCYILGSHKPSPMQQLNLKLCMATGRSQTTDVFALEADNVLPIMAPRGTLILSHQSGSHRGIPQGPSANRMMAVMNFVMLNPPEPPLQRVKRSLKRRVKNYIARS